MRTQRSAPVGVPSAGACGLSSGPLTAGAHRSGIGTCSGDRGKTLGVGPGKDSQEKRESFLKISQH